MIWRVRNLVIDLTGRPLVIGILNVTPDSFSDGGLYLSSRAALEHAERMIEEGADALDVGAESTRPGGSPVGADEQIDRAIPVIAAIRVAHPDYPLSIDTRSAQVAEAALDAGADIINDVSALTHDPAMAPLGARTGAGVILMHMMGAPETHFTDPRTGRPPAYGNVMKEIVDYLRSRLAAAGEAGLSAEQLVVDPGIGFGKNLHENLEILGRLGELSLLNRPVLIGASRKRFIGAVLNRDDPSQRLYGSLACVAAAILNGAQMVRVHDVAPSVEVVRMCSAIASQPRSTPGGCFPGGTV